MLDMKNKTNEDTGGGTQSTPEVDNYSDKCPTGTIEEIKFLTEEVKSSNCVDVESEHNEQSDFAQEEPWENEQADINNVVGA